VAGDLLINLIRNDCIGVEGGARGLRFGIRRATLLKDGLFLLAELGRGTARGIGGFEELVITGVFDGDTSVLGGGLGLEGGFGRGWTETRGRDNHLIHIIESCLEGRGFRGGSIPNPQQFRRFNIKLSR
jgi:hypothetical protein